MDRHPAKITRGETSIEAMNLMGYDAMALGSLDVSALTRDELRQRISEADFAVLSANAYIADTQELLADPYIVIEMADHRVGILGLTDAVSVEDVSVTDPLQAAQSWLPELQGKADIIIVLSHAGLEVDQVIAERIPGIDVIVSGRSMTSDVPIIVQRTGTVLLHADTPQIGGAGERVGVAHLSFDKDGHLLRHDWTKIILTSDYAEDSEMNSWMRRIKTP